MPTFGYANQGVLNTRLENTIIAGKFHGGAGKGVSIIACISIYAINYPVKAALYDASGNLVLNGETEELVCPGNYPHPGTPTFYEFHFPIQPDLTDQDYYIALWTQASTTGDAFIYYDTGILTDYYRSIPATYGPSFPSALGNSDLPGRLYSVSCNYAPSGTPVSHRMGHAIQYSNLNTITNYALTNWFDLLEPGVPTAISAYLTAMAGPAIVRFGIYEYLAGDRAGGLLANTEEITLPTGFDGLITANIIAPVNLPAGRYHLMANNYGGGNVSIYRGSWTDGSKRGALSWCGYVGIPDPFGAGETVTEQGAPASIYMDYTPSGSPPASVPRTDTIYWTLAELAQMKDRVSLPTHNPIYENVVQWAIDHIDDPFPTIVANDYGSWSNGITSMRRFIETMVFMYWMTDDVAYAEAGIRWLMTIPTLSSDSMYPGFWQIPCGMAMVLASGYDGFHALLTPVELQTLRMEMIGRCAEQMGPLNADYYPNFLAQMTAYGVCGLALGDDYMGSAEWVSYGVQQANFIFDRLVDGWAEGGMYATYALDVLIPFLDALKRKAGIDILAERGEILNQMADYYIYMNYNGGPLPMEDSVDKDHWDRNYAVGLSVMYWLANRYGNGYALYFADALVDQSRWAAFAWKPTIPPLDIATLPTTRYFPGIGYVIARSAWGPLAAGDNSLIVIFKSGHSAWHAHPNQNSFNVFMNGSWVTAGPGYITNDDRYDRSRTMNVILGDDREQAQEIGDYENAPYDTRGIVEEVEVAPYYVYARGDATPVYTAIDPSVGDLQWKRHIAIIDGSYFVIMDDVKAPAPEKLEFLFQGNRGSFSLADNLVRLSHGIQLDCVVVEPSPYVTQLITDTNITRFPQMRIRSPAPVAAQNFLTVFFPNIPVLPVTEYKQGNLLGVSVRTDADHIDLILFSADGNPVSELIELGDYYVADDGGSYTFDGTRVAVNFNQYMVMNLVKTGPAIQNHAIIAIQFYDKYGILLI